MKLTDDPLWSRLQAFEFDIAGDTLTFTKRLARENGWQPDYSQRVAEEYRRFIYLTQRAGHPVTPSDEVDQAWHLHLVYTRSYWDELCAQVLERPLHHGPTRGGRTEDAKYHDWYAKTLESYARLFGAAPPADIWPEPAQRFSRKARWRRVDTGAHWLISKSRTRQAAVIAACALLFGSVLAACSASADGPGFGGWLICTVGIIGTILYMAKRHSTPGDRKNNETSGSGCSPGATTGCGGGHLSDAGNDHDRDNDGNHEHDSSNDSSSHDSSGGDSSGGDSGCSSGGCGGGCGGGD